MKFTVLITFCDPMQYIPLAMAVEEHGLDAVAVPDSVFYPEEVSARFPYSSDGRRFWKPETPWLEPWVVIPAMAAVTRRIHFSNNVLKLPIRHPLLVAKAVGSAAVLSGNRVALGVGLSWIPEESRWLGQDFETRGPRADEAIAIIRLALTGKMIEHHGKYYDFGRLQMAPAPSQPVPIYVGGQSMPALRRAARLGDGWVATRTTVAELQESIPTLHRLRDEFGRSHEPFEIKVACAEIIDADGIRRLADLGVTDFITIPWFLYGRDTESLDAKRAAIARYAEQVVAKVRSS